jgi:hypothetical protein
MSLCDPRKGSASGADEAKGDVTARLEFSEDLLCATNKSVLRLPALALAASNLGVALASAAALAAMLVSL